MKKIPKTEYLTMKFIWSQNCKMVASKDITHYMSQNYGWSKGTTGKLLSRLVQKEFLESKKDGRNTIYKVLISDREYTKLETKEFFECIHNKSLTSIISALGENEDISEHDISELEEWIKSRK